MKTDNSLVDPVMNSDDESDDELAIPEGIVSNAMATFGGFVTAISNKGQEVLCNLNCMHCVIAVILFLAGATTGARFESQRHQPNNAVIEMAEKSKVPEQPIRERVEEPMTQSTHSPIISPRLPYTPRKVVMGSLVNEN